MEIVPLLSKKAAEYTSAALKSAVKTAENRSDRIRTCGILLPKQARYQLRYTPNSYYKNLLYHMF